MITFLFVPWDAGAWAVAAGFVRVSASSTLEAVPRARLERLESVWASWPTTCSARYAATLMSLATSVYMAV